MKSKLDKLREVPIPKQFGKRGTPLWDGPSSDKPNGGCTFSLLSRWLNCRERFRIYAIDGVKAVETFCHRRDFGNLWHLCEEHLAHFLGSAKGKLGQLAPCSTGWLSGLRDLATELSRKYPLARAEIDKWYNVILIQFPLYIEHWKKHPDTSKTTHLLQEHVFDVPYKLPSGRVVRLRGKWDGVDLIEDKRGKGIYLFETKTKSEIDQEKISRQLTFDLQVMLYLVSIQEKQRDGSLSEIVTADGMTKTIPIRGVRYNVVRRPLSGGKGTIIQKKGSKNVRPETKEEFYGRLRGIISDSPTDFFARWKVEITPGDIQRFRERCLDPILENLCWWYEEVTGNYEHFRKDGLAWKLPPSNWIHPFGVENYINEGGHSDVDEYLTNGSMAGLTVTDSLFKELE